MATDTESATHGNVVVAQGDCPICGRQNVPLTRKQRYEVHPSLVCANEFACFAAWQATRSEGGTRIVDHT